MTPLPDADVGGTPSGVEIRRELPGDAAAIHRVNELAFDEPREADLVDALRGAGAVRVLELVPGALAGRGGA